MHAASDAPDPPDRPRSLADQAVRSLAAAVRLTEGRVPWVRPAVVTRHTVRLARLPGELDGLTVAHLTDLHASPLFTSEAVAAAVAQTNALRPDLVALTGDFVQRATRAEEPGLLAPLGRLEARLGVHAVLGNHDHWGDLARIRDLLAQLGIPLLTNAGREVAGGLWLLGVDDYMGGNPDPAAVRAALPADRAAVLLCHTPGGVANLRDRPWLVLAGHTHGFQFSLPGFSPHAMSRLPGVAPLLYAYEWLQAYRHDSPREAICSYQYPGGWYRVGEALMYVSRGVGYFPETPFRINCPAEIAHFTLRAGEPADETALLDAGEPPAC